MATTEVIVVGAGIAGASTAFALANLGVDVTLLERRHPASGPTGFSSAVCHAAYLTPELWRLAARGTEILRNIPELTGGPSCYAPVGMFWVLGANAAPAWREAVRSMRSEGILIEELSAAEVRRRAPRFAHEGIEIGVWEPLGGYADPHGATNALVDAARRRGARVMLNSSVEKFGVTSGRISGVETSTGEHVAADVVVLATGVWTRPLVAQLGVTLPIHVERHAMAVLDAPKRAREVLPFSWCDDILCHYARPEGDSTILAGTWAGGGTGVRNESFERSPRVDDPEHYDNSVDADESAEILRHITPRIPEFGALGIRKGYAGLYDMSPDDLPIIDAVPGVGNAFVICGSSGHGFKLGPAVGEAVAELVTRGASALLRPFNLQRFG